MPSVSKVDDSSQWEPRRLVIGLLLGDHLQRAFAILDDLFQAVMIC